MHSALVLAIACGSGLLIGLIGIGGVLLVPLLTLSGVPVHEAIAASLMSYIFSGLVGTAIYARAGSIAWGPAAWLMLGATPGAFFGAALASATPSVILLALMASVMVLSALRSFSRQERAEAREGPAFSPLALAALGLAVGVGSPLTGTGGPVLLVPLLLWFRLPVMFVIGLSQAIQIPIALLATFSNVVYGRIDWTLGGLLAIGLVVGSAAGAQAAHAMPRAALARLVSVVLLVVSGILVLRLRHDLLAR